MPARALGALALAGTLALTGCTGEDEPSGTDAGTAVVDGTDGAGGTAGADGGQQSAGPVAPPTGPSDIQPVDGERSASGDGSITVDADHAGFVLPSGSIACSVTRESAVCQVDDGPAVKPEHLAQENLPGCEAGEANAIRLVAGRGAWTCVADALVDQATVGTGGWWVEDVGGTTTDQDGKTLAVLPYGSSLTLGSVTCSSAESGVTCANDAQGEQFQVSSGGYSYN
ncbi:hypothetical protein DV701_14395 [Ornithinimicrobium avium]|uniref:Uncharacterized protein n=1 Tax=Ornithinimicrobium avium TaxID=2283195 RepID=A0A345NQ40_9MICO|nr:hypothetical protein DV701_14395 [Ornithinimicrobium avium]